MAQQNFFAKLVASPSAVSNPNKISLQQFKRDNSLEMEAQHFRPNCQTILQIFRWCDLTVSCGSLVGEKWARCELFGRDSSVFCKVYKGGSYLDLTTYRESQHYAYNRKFQRMFHLAQAQTGDASIHSAVVG